ncbi:hypothetical protein SDC9_114110 [bioreactor metagenome]|uniref:Uncharacterized protein n=1 Tax=bioreactor metagenome TaxID=1076179 RepID=A0A645BVE7_9ZZZZ
MPGIEIAKILDIKQDDGVLCPEIVDAHKLAMEQGVCWQPGQGIRPDRITLAHYILEHQHERIDHREEHASLPHGEHDEGDDEDNRHQQRDEQ